MKEKYKVIRIDEPDFGCEGLPDGVVPMANVILKNKDSREIRVQEEDALLYRLDINEGDEVWVEDGVIKK